MYCIFSNNNNIYYHLAAEEFLLKHKDEDIMMLWKSDSSVVVGKHQNAFAEINNKFVYDNNISIARRITGGGAVYHDAGNLNFTFIVNGNPGKLVDFKKFVNPVLAFLATLGINATIGLKNDILINGLKISGNAEHVHKNRVLHHGTLLFNTDLSVLREALKVVPGRYIDKAVQSNRSSVTNIKEHLSGEISLDEFSGALYKFLMQQYLNATEYQFNEQDITIIDKLCTAKYATWDWIYGYSPPFSLKRYVSIDNRNFSIEIYVEKGYITKVKTDGHTSFSDFRKSIHNLIGQPYTYTTIKKLVVDSAFTESVKTELIRGLL